MVRKLFLFSTPSLYKMCVSTHETGDVMVEFYYPFVATDIKEHEKPHF